MAIGRSKPKVYVENDTKDELREIVAFLKDPQGFGRLGARMPKGVLLDQDHFLRKRS